MLHAIMNQCLVIDQRICASVYRWNGRKYLDYTMYGFSFLGNGPAYFVVGGFILYFDPAALRIFLPATAVAFLIELTAYKVLKQLFRRDRPFISMQGITFLIKPADKFSFPSGHTAAAFVMATVIYYFYSPFAITSYAIAATIGLSRIYNGVHYPSDVLAGAMLGVSSASIGIACF